MSARGAAREYTSMGHFEAGMKALDVAESMAKDTKLGRALSTFTRNSVYRRAMSVAKQYANDKKDMYATEVVERAITAAGNSGSDKVNQQAMRNLILKSRANHVEALVHTAGLLMKDGDHDAAARAIAEAQIVTETGADRGYKEVGYFGQRTINKVVEAMPEKVAAMYEEAKVERSAAARGLVYRSISLHGNAENGIDFEGAAKSMAKLAERSGRSIMTTVNGKEVIVHDKMTEAQALAALNEAATK
jgi:hypothetical protein